MVEWKPLSCGGFLRIYPDSSSRDLSYIADVGARNWWSRGEAVASALIGATTVVEIGMQYSGMPQIYPKHEWLQVGGAQRCYLARQRAAHHVIHIWIVICGEPWPGFSCLFRDQVNSWITVTGPTNFNYMRRPTFPCSCNKLLTRDYCNAITKLFKSSPSKFFII